MQIINEEKIGKIFWEKKCEIYFRLIFRLESYTDSTKVSYGMAEYPPNLKLKIENTVTITYNLSRIITLHTCSVLFVEKCTWKCQLGTFPCILSFRTIICVFFPKSTENVGFQRFIHKKSFCLFLMPCRIINSVLKLTSVFCSFVNNLK